MLVMVYDLSLLIRDWRVVLLLVAGISLTPGRASAACGDYISIHNAVRDLASSANPDQSALITNPIALNEPGNSTPSKLPCHGPNCSNSPVRQLPPLAPATPVGLRVKELVQHPVPTDDDVQPGLSSVCDNTLLSPIDHTSAIFHPPRLG